MTWPALIDLELLVLTEGLGSVSAAARELGLTQSEASRRMSRLEKSVDMRLLDRSHTGSRLTKRGELVTEWSHQLLEQATQWQAGVSALHEAASSHLEIAASQTIAEYLAPLWLAAYKRSHDDATVRLEVHNSARVMEMVRTQQVHLGLIETPMPPADLSNLSVGHDRLVVVVSPEHPWRRRRSITLQDLADTPLVVREPGSGTRQTLEAALSGMTSAPPQLELPSNAAVLSAVASGAAPAVISALAASGALSDGRLYRVPLAGPLLERTLRAVWKASSHLDDAALAFLDMVTADQRDGSIARARRPTPQ